MGKFRIQIFVKAYGEQLFSTLINEKFVSRIKINQEIKFGLAIHTNLMDHI